MLASTVSSKILLAIANKEGFNFEVSLTPKSAGFRNMVLHTTINEVNITIY